LLLVTIGLVLAGLVLLIVGFVQDSLSYIFVSIACAAVAAIALIVFGRLSRRRSLQIALDGGSAKLAPERQHAPARRSQVEVPTTTSRSRAPEAQSPVERLAEMATARSMAARREPDVTVAEEEEPLRERADWAPAPATPTAPIPAATTSYREPEPEWQPGGQWDEDDEWGEEVVFPIEDYDELRVAEIMPLLTELEPDELEEVRDRESTGKDRSTIIFRIDELLGREPVEAAPTPRPAPVPPPAPALSRRATAFPIPRYDDLRVSDVLPLLADLDAIGLERVRAHETALKDRATIVQRVDDLLGRGRAGVGEPAAAPGRIPARLVPTAAPKPAAIPAPTRKRAASPAPARAMPTKRRAAAKAAPGPTAKAAAGRKAAATAPAPTRKAAATTGKAAAPAQTRAASPAPGKGAKRAAPAAAKKTAPAPVKRAAPAAKKTTKAAAPVRRAAPAAGKATPARKAAKKR
jgi:hypothetical protein